MLVLVQLMMAILTMSIQALVSKVVNRYFRISSLYLEIWIPQCLDSLFFYTNDHLNRTPTLIAFFPLIGDCSCLLALNMIKKLNITGKKGTAIN